MPLAKRFLAKLARFYRRLKQRPVRRLNDKGTKYVKKCNKGCGTFPDFVEVGDLRSDSFAGDACQLDTPKNAVKSKAEIKLEPRTLAASHTIIKERIAAGNEGSSDVGTQADGGPILENGISKRAFCRQLDNLLQRTLGADCGQTRVWARSNTSFC